MVQPQVRGTSPEHALLLRDFANTVDLSEGTDVLADPPALSRWLASRGLIPAGPGDAVGQQADLEAALRLRSALRSALRAHDTAHTGSAPSGLDAATASLPLRLAEVSGEPVLVPAEGGVRGGLAALVAAIAASTADESWARLKICADDSCQWAFLDSSKNRSRHRCSMQECGNRSKTRAYRARRAAQEPAAQEPAAQEPGR